MFIQTRSIDFYPICIMNLLLEEFLLFVVDKQFGFLLIALIWKFDFSPFMVLIIAILNDG